MRRTHGAVLAVYAPPEFGSSHEAMWTTLGNTARDHDVCHRQSMTSATSRRRGLAGTVAPYPGDLAGGNRKP